VDTGTLIVVVGVLVGLLYGMFGVGSAFATPMLSLFGVSGMAAVVGPLPGLLPGSAAGAWSYSRHGKVDWQVARRALVGGLPATVLGAIASHWIGSPVLLVLSGTVLFVVGLRILRPGSGAATELAARRRASTAFVVTAAAVVGFSAGLLANGGGFLLVPLFLVALGLDINEAAGTSLVVAAILTMPTLVTHAFIGDVDWFVAGAFALGLVPGAFVGSRVAQRLPTDRLRYAFGVFLVLFALWFLMRQLGVVFG
jgi:uncharacterized membrane protein YfcA